MREIASGIVAILILIIVLAWAWWLALSALLIWRFPTVQEWLQRQGPESEIAWSDRRGVLLASLFFLALLASMQQTARTFVYSQF